MINYITSIAILFTIAELSSFSQQQTCLSQLPLFYNPISTGATPLQILYEDDHDYIFSFYKNNNDLDAYWSTGNGILRGALRLSPGPASFSHAILSKSYSYIIFGGSSIGIMRVSFSSFTLNALQNYNVTQDQNQNQFIPVSLRENYKVIFLSYSNAGVHLLKVTYFGPNVVEWIKRIDGLAESFYSIHFDVSPFYDFAYWAQPISTSSNYHLWKINIIDGTFLQGFSYSNVNYPAESDSFLYKTSLSASGTNVYQASCLQMKSVLVSPNEFIGIIYDAENVTVFQSWEIQNPLYSTYCSDLYLDKANSKITVVIENVDSNLDIFVSYIVINIGSNVAQIGQLLDTNSNQRIKLKDGYITGRQQLFQAYATESLIFLSRMTEFDTQVQGNMPSMLYNYPKTFCSELLFSKTGITLTSGSFQKDSDFTYTQTALSTLTNVIKNQISQVTVTNITSLVTRDTTPSICNYRADPPTIVPTYFQGYNEYLIGSPALIVEFPPYQVITTCPENQVLQYQYWSSGSNTISLSLYYHESTRRFMKYQFNDTKKNGTYIYFYQISLLDGTNMYTGNFKINFTLPVVQQNQSTNLSNSTNSSLLVEISPPYFTSSLQVITVYSLGTQTSILPNA
ncbi:UNKNOWN [Stylonychia lemnae]|uniref:Uncharacterized protein n=1 Tax=Stylonychia lemnae TaxID=5949 RepID=A0A078AAG0_STYLE|nr:UNKNOWN [Stylonychia lemnae]|eukprot:CDW79184.1 UNKNOWN [Stylonychia lemnae]